MKQQNQHSCSVIYSYVEWDLDQWYSNVGNWKASY